MFQPLSRSLHRMKKIHWRNKEQNHLLKVTFTSHGERGWETGSSFHILKGSVVFFQVMPVQNHFRQQLGLPCDSVIFCQSFASNAYLVFASVAKWPPSPPQGELQNHSLGESSMENVAYFPAPVPSCASLLSFITFVPIRVTVSFLVEKEGSFSCCTLWHPTEEMHSIGVGVWLTCGKK